MHVVYDYRAPNVFQWTPIEEGTFVVRGVVLDRVSGATSSATKLFTTVAVTESRTAPVVSPTTNPIVALYSAPPCPPESTMRVHFLSMASGARTTTHAKPCRPGRTMNFYLGGMRFATSHLAWSEIVDSNGDTTGSSETVAFRTASSSFPQLAFPSLPADPRGSTEGVLLQSGVPPGNPGLGLPAFSHAVDLAGQVIWLAPIEPLGTILTRPGGQGTFYLVHNNFVSQRNLLSHVVRDTTLARLNDQLEVLGVDTVESLHHEARPLPNGHLRCSQP